MDEIEIVKCDLSYLDELLKIYENARLMMRNSGNPNQRKTTDPSVETIKKRIISHHFYIGKYKNDISSPILFAFALIDGIDPTYINIYDGKRLNNEPYMAIHSLVSSFIIKNSFYYILNYALKFTKNIRIDTHQDNKIMQHILIKNGFKHCGTIILANGEPRLAFQLSVK